MSYSEDEKCWTLVTISQSGVVSMLEGLNAPTARQVYQRLLPATRPYRLIESAPTDSNVTEHLSFHSSSAKASASAIARVEVIGPEGAELDPWRGVEPEVVCLSTLAERMLFQNAHC